MVGVALVVEADVVMVGHIRPIAAVPPAAVGPQVVAGAHYCYHLVES